MRRTTEHIVFVGLPDSGKSTIGMAVARRLHRPFFDIDNYPDLSSSDDAATQAADREWIRRMCALSTPAVIATPWTCVDELFPDDEGTPTLPPSWIVLLDAPDGAVDGVDREHLDTVRTLADVVVEEPRREVDDLVDDLVARCSAHFAPR